MKLAKPVGVEAFDAAMDPAFAVAIGLVSWGFAREVGEGRRPIEQSAMGRPLHSIGQWLKNFLP